MTAKERITEFTEVIQESDKKATEKSVTYKK